MRQLVTDVLPHDASGNQIDLSPADPLPEGAVPPARPDLYGAAEWATGMFCRCYPERCRGATDGAP